MSLIKRFSYLNVFIIALSFTYADFIETGCDLPENSLWANDNLILYNVDTDIQSFTFTIVGATSSSGSGGDMLLIPPSFCTISIPDASTGEIQGTCFGQGIFGINPDGCGVLTELQDFSGSITNITDIVFNTTDGGTLGVIYCSDCVQRIT